MSGSEQVGDGGADPGATPRPELGDGGVSNSRDGAEGGNELGLDALRCEVCGAPVEFSTVCDKWCGDFLMKERGR
jgi:hypothetical protein